MQNDLIRYVAAKTLWLYIESWRNVDLIAFQPTKLYKWRHFTSPLRKKHLKWLELMPTSSCVNLVTIASTVLKLHRGPSEGLPPPPPPWSDNVKKKPGLNRVKNPAGKYWKRVQVHVPITCKQSANHWHSKLFYVLVSFMFDLSQLVNTCVVCSSPWERAEQLAG